MSLTTETTRKEFAGIVRGALAGVKPPPAPLTPAQVVAKFRRVLLSFRAKGYTLEQLATCLEHPDIGVKLAPATLGRLLRQTRPTRRRRQTAAEERTAPAGAQS